MLCLGSQTYCCYDVTFKKFKLGSKGLNKHVLEQGGNGLLEKYKSILNKKINFTSNKRGFRTNDYPLATYQQLKKGISYFYPKRIAESDGIHTQTPKL